MTAEHKIMVEREAKSRERWVKKAGHLQNHFWDCEVYNRAMAFRIGVQQMRGDSPSSSRRRPPQPTTDRRDHDEEPGRRLWGTW